MQEGFIEKSFVLEDGDLEKINQFTRTEFKSDELYAFSVILCDNNIDRDYEKFSVESLYQLCDKFLGKTGICDHSMKSADQKARIFHTWVEKVNGRKTQDGEELYQLKAKAYMVKTDENMPLIKEIEAGIKKEVSVSCSMKKSICSICSNDKRSTYCEHINGKSYDGKLAYSVLSDVSDAYEFSFVAVPAQREAGVTKSFNGLKDDDNMMKNVIDTLKSCSDGITLSKAQATEIADHISALEEEAKLGRDYKKSLIAEVVGLCSKALPQMDINIFGSVAQVMTTKELLGFKTAFLKSKDQESFLPQLTPQTAKKAKNDQFKL